MTLQTIVKNQGLVKAFKRYSKLYLSVGKKPNIKKLLPDDLYSTMRLEGERVTKKEAQAIFR